MTALLIILAIAGVLGLGYVVLRQAEVSIEQLFEDLW